MSYAEAFQAVLECLLKRQERPKKKMLPHWEGNRHHFNARLHYLQEILQFKESTTERRGKKSLKQMCDCRNAKMTGCCIQRGRKQRTQRMQDLQGLLSGQEQKRSFYICLHSRCSANHVFTGLITGKGPWLLKAVSFPHCTA